MAKNDTIFAASAGQDIVELTIEFDEIKKHWGRENQPVTMDANKEYLIVGYRRGNNFAGFSHIDIKGRHDYANGFQISEVQSTN